MFVLIEISFLSDEQKAHGDVLIKRFEEHVGDLE